MNTQTDYHITLTEELVEQRRMKRNFDDFFAKVQEYSDSPNNDYNCRGWKDELCAIIDHQDFKRFQRAVEYMTGGGFAIVKVLEDESSLFVIADGYWENVEGAA